jgi:hypothetical protein
MLADGRAIPQLIINTDYDDTPPSALASAYVASGSQWNGFNWNDGSNWSGSLQQLADWITVGGSGSCAAVRMRLAPNNTQSTAAITLELNGFELKWEQSQGLALSAAFSSGTTSRSRNGSARASARR